MNAKTISSGGRVTLNDTDLVALRKNLGELAKLRVKVGVLGPKAARADQGTVHNPEGLNNAEIGLRNEFGVISERVPERSFIRMPLIVQLPKILKGGTAKQWIQTLIKQGPAYVMGSLGLAGEHAVQEAFATKGFGKWKPNAPLTVILKGSARPLIDHGELRQAISSEVIKLP